MKAIETQYKGYRFRSRLEARWACFFDALSIPWKYEVEGYDLGAAGFYLPDFALTDEESSRDFWLEVKAANFTMAEFHKALHLAIQTKRTVVLADGLPEFRSYEAIQYGGHGGEERAEVANVLIDWKKRRLWWEPSQGEIDALRTDPDYCRAVVAARSARFEFGESGAAA